MVKRPELSQTDKNIKTKVKSLFGKWNEEKVQTFVFKCREKKSKVVRKIHTQEKYRYLKNLLKYSNKVFVLCYFPPLYLIIYHISWSLISELTHTGIDLVV